MLNKRVLIIASAVLTAAPVFAHHSTAMFDRSKRVWVEGTVKSWQWTNPHVWLQVMAPDSSGKLVEQGFEAGAPNTLIRDGFRKDSFKPGDKVKVLASPRFEGLGGLYYCARTSAGKWLVFGMGPSSTPPAECAN